LSTNTNNVIRLGSKAD